MLLLKIFSKSIIYSFAALFLAAFFCAANVYRIIKELAKVAWHAVLPKKLRVYRLRKLTEEDKEDLKSYYKGKGMTSEDYVPWGGVRP